MQGKEKCAANFLNFNPVVHLITEIILEHSCLCYFMVLVDISEHVWGFFGFWSTKGIKGYFEKDAIMDTQQQPMSLVSF